MRASDQFHVGIVVDDLAAALAELTALFGYEWADELHVAQPVALADGEHTIDFQFHYSRTVPRLEVIQSQHGTLWTPVPGSGLHHVGYWSDDVDADGEALVAAGYGREAAGLGSDAGPGWAYHRHPTGLRIELVSRRLEPLLAPLWSPAGT